MPVLRLLRSTILIVGSCALFGCAHGPDSVTVVISPEGMVSLERQPSRGTTIRYSGQLKSLEASHPVSLPPALLERALSGIHIGIAPPEPDGTGSGIKPTPLFSRKETAFLAPAIAAALEKAEPDQHVTFHVGPEADRSGGTLYVEGHSIQLALSHYHSAAHRKDDALSIYILSFKPVQAQHARAIPPQRIHITPDQPRLSIDYAALEVLLLTDSPSKPGKDVSAGDRSRALRDRHDAAGRQAEELESLRSEVEALKKQIQEQSASPSKPMP